MRLSGWWIAGDFTADRAARPAELERLARSRVIRPGLTFALWLAIAVLVLVNDMIGDTFIADRLPAMAIEWYKVLVPLPYVVLMAIIHARRTAGPKWFEAALLAALLWPPTTVLAEYLYGRHHLRAGARRIPRPLRLLVGRAFYPLLVVVLLSLHRSPAGWLTNRRRESAIKPSSPRPREDGARSHGDGSGRRRGCSFRVLDPAI